MKSILKYLSSALIATAFGASFTSCDDWTEPEHVDINYSNVEGAENYQEYLAALRNYRKKDHVKVYAWVYVNENGPLNQSERLTSLPDSIDVIVLSTPSEIHPTVLADMKKVREDKGMKMMYEIDFDAIKASHTTLCESLAKQRSDLDLEFDVLISEAETEEQKNALLAELAQKKATLADPAFEDYVLEKLTSSLNYVKSKGLDGVVFAFDGKATTHLTEAEIADYNARQLVFLGAARDWHKRNPEMKYDFMGKPQNISDKELLGEFDMIFIRQGLDATNASLYTYYLSLAAVEGVPAERLGMMTTFTSSDPDDTTTGVFTDGTFALDGFTNWVASAKVACVGIKNVQNDYFYPAFSYPHVRTVIQAANPNIK
jgi:hypothetical protein